ncbi:MAG: hypothetical protein AAGA69_11390, partial [Pseudomonadota bacterium]
AALTRAEGEERAREIRAEAEKEVVRIRASAEERSQIIRGRADAIRNCIFANAYQGVAADIRTVDLPEAPVEPLVSVEGEPQSEPAPVNVEEELAQMLGISCVITGDPSEGDPRRREFFAFYRSLTAYEQTLAQEDDDTTIILSPDGEFREFFQYFSMQPTN